MASARSGMALGPIQRLFDEGTLTGLTDAQLVERFLDRRDEGAFAALVRGTARWSWRSAGVS